MPPTRMKYIVSFHYWKASEVTKVISWRYLLQFNTEHGCEQCHNNWDMLREMPGHTHTHTHHVHKSQANNLHRWSLAHTYYKFALLSAPFCWRSEASWSGDNSSWIPIWSHLLETSFASSSRTVLMSAIVSLRLVDAEALIILRSSKIVFCC